jgi:hypothetical protein
MKNVLKKTAGLLLALALLSSCSTVRVAFPTSENKGIDKVAFISTYVDIQKPVIPLINAAIINEKTNSISAEITGMFEENVNVIREDVAKQLKDNLNCEVLFGSVLQNTPGFKEVKETYNLDNALIKNDTYFPEMIACKGDINPFEFNKARVAVYFRKPNYTNTVADICKKLQVNYVLVSYSLLVTVPGSLLIRGSIAPYTYLYLFNKNGECIASGSNYAKAVTFNANELEGYQQALEKQPELLTPIMEKIAAKYKN